MLVDVFQKLNKLEIKFQYDMVDITTISGLVNIIIYFYYIIFFLLGMDLCLVGTSKNLGNFLREFKNILERIRR